MAVKIAGQRVRSCDSAILVGLAEFQHGKNHKLVGAAGSAV